MKKIFWKIASLIGAAVIIAIIAIRIYKVNASVVPTEQADYGVGDEIVLGDNFLVSRSDCDWSDYSVKIEGYELLTYSEYLKKYNYTEDPGNPLISSEESLYPEMIYDLDITFRNLNDQEGSGSGIDLIPYKLYGTDFQMEFSDELYYLSNPGMEDIGFRFALRPGTSKTFHIPFFFQPSAASGAVSVEKTLQDDLYLMISEYPVRNLIHLRGEEHQ